MAAAVTLTPPVAEGQSFDSLPESDFIKQSERFTPEGGGPIDLRFAIARDAAGQLTRFVDTTRAALTMMAAWFGPAPAAQLTVTGVFVPPGSAIDATPGNRLVAAPVHWLTPARDQRTERELIRAIAREYWSVSDAPVNAFERAVIAYAGARAVNQLLEGSNFATPVFFGGVIPFPLRSVLLSPPVGDPRPRAWGFDEPVRVIDAATVRTVRALQVIERYVGWPTMLETLSRVRIADRRDAETFAATLSDVRGTNMQPLVMECLRPDAVFDYAIDSLQSQPGPSGLVETTMTISRRGNGTFAIRDAAGDGEAAMPVLVRFADGTEARDYFDGAAPSVTLIYSAKAAAVSAAIDPDLMLLLDVDRENNAVVRDVPVAPLGVRLALHWMTWLQNAMLSYNALL